MNISFENPDKVNGVLTLVVEESDYKADVEKTLKAYRKKANVPGFRQGQVPMSLVKRQYEQPVKMDAINKLIGDSLQKYVADNKIAMLGTPLQHEGAEPVDLEKAAPYTFQFDIAVAPEFDATLSDKDTVDYYDITVDDELLDKQVEMFQNRAGHYDKVDAYDAAERDMLKGDLRELDENGNTLEGGLTIEAAIMMPIYFKNEDQKKLFEGAKVGDILTFNPSVAYEGSDAEIAALLKIEKGQVAEHKGDFSYQLTEVSRFVKAENNQELWNQVYGEDADIKDEAGFRAAIKEGVSEQLVQDADYRFIQDLRAYCEKKVGELTYPDALLKRIMLQNNQEKGQEFVDNNYDQSIKELTWHLIKEQLAEANGIKVDDNDLKETAVYTTRMQFAQYGMAQVPEEVVEKYAEEMLKKREQVDALVEACLDKKLAATLKNVVTLNKKAISLEEFNKLVTE